MSASLTTSWALIQFHPEMPELLYTHKSYLHEPLTFMSYLAGITKKLQLVTAILILPQRQTALVAKKLKSMCSAVVGCGWGLGWLESRRVRGPGREFP